MKPGLKGKEKLLGFEGLRTFALFGVLLFHMFPRAVPGGYFGVILFFVISGFLSGCSAASAKTAEVLPYYAKRARRIYPSLVIMVFITVEAIALADRFRLQNAQGEILSVLLGYNNYWQIFASADYFANLSANSAFTHLWYIAILIQFELIWPWLYRFASKGRKNAAIGLLFLVSLFVMPVLSFVPSVSKTLLYYGTFCRIHALIGGAWLGCRYVSMKRKRKVKPVLSLAAILLFFAGSVLLFLFAGGGNDWVYHFGIVGYALFSCFTLMMVLLDQSVSGRLLDHPFCAFFSRYSYEIYLWQYPVLFLFGLKNLNTKIWHFALQALVILVMSVWTNYIVSRIFRVK